MADIAMRILVVEDEDALAGSVRYHLEREGYAVELAADGRSAIERFRQDPPALVILDLMLPEMSGLDVCRLIRQESDVPIIMVTAKDSEADKVTGLELGADDYVTKPFHVEELRRKLEHLARSVQLDQENRLLREQLRTRPGFGDLVGVSPKMQRVYQIVQKVSQHNYPVLILGESGTGKELIARSIHFLGPRRQKPFVPVDCSALVSTLIESELFGFVKGAFTGAVQNKRGLLESAEGGTLFLDEIGDLPVDLQAKLLRALQEKEIKPVGSTDRVSINVRVIAATNRDLEAAIRNGSFRQDLYFRLNVVQVKLPPLRDRKRDIPFLVEHFLEKFSDPQGPGRSIAPDALARLMAYEWPGNVRELENAIERAVALGSGTRVEVNDLPSNLQYGVAERLTGGDDLVPLEELEKRAIFRALKETGGDKLAAARLLRIGKTTLYRKLKQYERQSRKG